MIHRLTIAALLLLSLLPLGAQAQGTYWSRESLLRDFFADSERVSYLEVKVDAALVEALGYTPSRDRYVVYVATTGDRVDGYALLDDELGQHHPISFGVQLDPAGRVVRSEIMVYREPYGAEIKSERFRDQFVGKAASDAGHFSQGVVAVSGATLSSRAMTKAVRRATLIVGALLDRQASRAIAGA